MSPSRNALLGAMLLVGLGAGCTCGIFDPSTTRFLCSTDADCAEGFTCRPAGNAKECVAGSSGGTNGASCSGSGDCESGFCVAGVCCESGCSGACESCALSTSRGRCVAKPGGTTCNTDYVCDGTARTCPSSCAGIAQCASARDCVGNACVDLDECGSSGICGANATCTNTPGSWECSCASGFVGATTTGGPASCTDVNECSSNPDCGPLAVCSNVPGSWECSCPSGTFGATVTGGPTSCSTVDRCTTPGMCGANATCASTATSYSCTCSPGYSGTTTMGGPATCADLDECTSPTSACGANATCTNTTGSYQCACASGFSGSATTGMPATCVDVDECPAASCGANASCTNSPGSYVCSCDADFMGTPVTGGPAVCTAIDRCTAVSCGANATCASVPGNYTCTCNTGFQGATVTGGPASCMDLDECAIPGGGCGANALCTNTPGSYGCTCAPGYTGATTTGMPATCVAGTTLLGTVQGRTPRSILLAQPVAMGTSVALALVAGTDDGLSVSDTRGNTWIRVAHDSSCGACGTASLYTATLTNAWTAGDSVTIGGSSGDLIGAWLSALNAYPFFDVAGTYGSSMISASPSVATTAAPLEPDEVLIAAFATEDALTLTSSPDGGFTTELSITDSDLSGIIASKVGTGLSGIQRYSASSSVPERFSGFIATFYGGTQRPPTGLSLSHTPNSRSFTVSWTGGRGNGGGVGCAVQYRGPSGSWVTAQNTSCDTDANARTITLPGGTNWYGGSWSSVQVRVIRNGDQAVLGTFLTPLTCAARAASSTPTPTIDEDCDGTWDDRSCTTFSWVRGTVYSTSFTACTNSSDTTPTKACSSTNEVETRYTEGQGTQSPAVAFSSSSYGSACVGPYTGATAWTCTASNCSYR